MGYPLGETLLITLTVVTFFFFKDSGTRELHSCLQKLSPFEMVAEIFRCVYGP